MQGHDQVKLQHNRKGTFVCDGQVCVMGKYKPTNAGTAHQRLAKAAGMSKPLVGGSVKADGTIALRSESINAYDSKGRHVESRRDASGTVLGEWARMKIALGDIETTKTYKEKMAGP
mgnify:FL=1|eukprot:scaffold24835_cov30-Tisochrysis_lutea.AAC.1